MFRAKGFILVFLYICPHLVGCINSIARFYRPLLLPPIPLAADFTTGEEIHRDGWTSDQFKFEKLSLCYLPSLSSFWKAITQEWTEMRKKKKKSKKKNIYIYTFLYSRKYKLNDYPCLLSRSTLYYTIEQFQSCIKLRVFFMFLFIKFG